MKYVLFVLAGFILFMSCSKNDDPVIVNTQTPLELQSKVWLFDSVITTTANYTTTDYANANEEQTIVFSSDTLVITTGSSHTTYNSYYNGASILYYWIPGSPDTRSMYWQIDSVSDSRLVTKQFPQTDKTLTFFYHVKL